MNRSISFAFSGYNTFVYDYGNAATPGTYMKLGPVSIVPGTLSDLPTPTRTGYEFTGWYTAAVGGKQVHPSTQVFADVEYFAHWEPITYNIVYNDMDGASAGSNHPTGAVWDETFTIDNPSRNGYVFDGWQITGMDSTEHTYDSDTTTSTSLGPTFATSYKNLTSETGAQITFTATWSKEISMPITGLEGNMFIYGWAFVALSIGTTVLVVSRRRRKGPSDSKYDLPRR